MLATIKLSKMIITSKLKKYILYKQNLTPLVLACWNH